MELEGGSSVVKNGKSLSICFDDTCLFSLGPCCVRAQTMLGRFQDLICLLKLEGQDLRRTQARHNIDHEVSLNTEFSENVTTF